MIQLQAINNILNNNNIEKYLNANIEAKHLMGYEQEFQYIVDHYNQYNKVPDLVTYLSKFPDTDMIEVLEPTEYIINNLKEDYLYEQGVKLFTEAAKMLEQNSYEGLRHIAIQAEQLLTNTEDEEGININAMAEEKTQEIKNKMNHEGLIGISSGLPELDEITGGWLPGEELVTIVGRVNQGKSWLLQKFLTEANRQGKKVLLYSGEMSWLQVAYRNDTLMSNFSNRQLMRGTISEADFDKYVEYLESNKKQAPFIVITPKHLGNRYLTVSMLKVLIKKYKPDIVGIDQLSLMDDEKKAGQKRLELANITAGLFNLSEQFHIPILADAQANRNTANADNPENPGLGDIAESDAIGQNSSRMISLVQTKLGLSLFMGKNRYGENNKKLVYAWDIDAGTFRYVQDAEIQQEDEKQEDTQITLKTRNNRQRTGTDVF